MQTRPLGATGLNIAPLVLGGNVFGWTADEAMSFSLLDAFVDAGLNAIDTADIYSKWAPGHQGGESETIIGYWLARRPANRERIVLITKVGSEFDAERKGLSRRWIERAVEDSLRRLHTDHLDVYLTHWPDDDTPIEETLGALQTLVERGLVRAVGASNLDANQLAAALQASEAQHVARYAVLQPEYNLYNRDKFEGPLRDLTLRENIGVISYYALASGYLSGKYRVPEDRAKSVRGARMDHYDNERGRGILAALDEVAAGQRATPAEVAVAWVIAQPGITAPIASATNLEQLNSLVKATRLELTPEELALLDAASR